MHGALPVVLATRAALALAAVFMVGHALAQSTYYDKYIHLRSLPSPPISPRSATDCDSYAERLGQRLQEVSQAHDTCLKAEKAGVQGVVTDVLDRCSNPACQDLHIARRKFAEEAENKKAACMKSLAQNPQKCAPPEHRSCANNCGGEWGMTCPYTRVCNPVKHRCEKAKP